MTRSALLATLPLLTALLVSPRPVSAQARDSAAPRDSAAAMAAIRDSLFQRARRLVREGDGAAGRALVDSLLQASSGTPAEGEALYWRAALASTAADAERDYRRVIVEHPFSPRLGDALYALAQLEMARGDRASAADHLQRFLLERPTSPERGRAGLLLGRMLLDQNDMARGCAVLTRTRDALGNESAELRNQVDYYAARCVGVDTTARPVAAAPVDSTARKPFAPAGAGRGGRGESAAAANSTVGRYTVQVAAFETRQAADELGARLVARGMAARVVGGPAAPFRVRIGYYKTQREAQQAAAGLKDKGITGFVTTTDVEGRPAPKQP